MGGVVETGGGVNELMTAVVLRDENVSIIEFQEKKTIQVVQSHAYVRAILYDPYSKPKHLCAMEADAGSVGCCLLLGVVQAWLVLAPAEGLEAAAAAAMECFSVLYILRICETTGCVSGSLSHMLALLGLSNSIIRAVGGGRCKCSMVGPMCDQ